MPALTNQSTSSIGIDFTDITAGHTIGVSAVQFLPAAEGGRKLTCQVIIDQGGGTPITANLKLTVRDLVYDEFGLYGNSLTADARKQLAVKY